MPSISNQYNNSAGSASPTLTISNVVIASGEQLFVAVGGSSGISVSDHQGIPTTVTYGGVGLTLITSQESDDDSDCVSWWQLKTPTPGTANVVITYPSNITHGCLGNAYAIAYGDKTVDATAGNNSTSATNPTTNNITTLTNNALALDIFTASSGSETISSPGANQTQDYNVSGIGSPYAGSHYTNLVSPAQQISFSWVPSNTGRGYAWSAISIAPDKSIISARPPLRPAIFKPG